MSLSLFPDNQFTDPQMLKEFMLSGKAKITVRSEKTLKHFTFKIKKERDKGVWYVSRLVSNGEYLYLGTIFEDEGMEFRTTRKTSAWAKINEGLKAFEWFWSKVGNGDMPPSVTVYHEGRCGMCGLELTDPISIKEGYGPECRKKRLHHAA